MLISIRKFLKQLSSRQYPSKLDLQVKNLWWTARSFSLFFCACTEESEGDCIVHVFFFSLSMVMVRRTSTGKTLPCDKSELASSRNSIHEGLKEKYFSPCFLLASPVGFALLQKDAVVLEDSWRGMCLWSNHIFENLQ